MATVALKIKNAPDIRYLAPPRAVAVYEPLILVVEDDPSIRRFICALLKWAAMARILEAADPQAALSMMRMLSRPIDMLISDIDLRSAKNGIDLAHEISAANPWLKVLLISGGKAPDCEMPQAWRFLEKPFAVAELLDVVTDALFSVKAAQASAKNVKRRFAAHG
jgi:two-component system, response regulator PdtaR